MYVFLSELYWTMLALEECKLSGQMMPDYRNPKGLIFDGVHKFDSRLIYCTQFKTIKDKCQNECQY